MATAKFTSPFAPLALSRYEEDQLEELASEIVAQLLVQYEIYRDVRGVAGISGDGGHVTPGTVDESRWKFLKQRDNVRVYKERSTSTTRRTTTTTTTTDTHTECTTTGGRPYSVTSEEWTTTRNDDSSSDRDNAATTEAPGDLPILLTVGSIQGDLYDTMYGVANPTLETMRIKTAYIQDGIVNAAVLATIREPIAEDPFRSLTVKWIIKGQPLHARTLVKNRDIVYVEATGLTRLPTTGEQVGYQLLHSVHFPQTKRLDGSLRGHISICALYRQQSHGVVDLFAKGFLDPTGRIARALVIKSATDAMLSSWRTIHTAQLKKFAHALRRRRAQSALARSRGEGSRVHTTPTTKPQRSASMDTASKSCALCTTPLSSLAAFSFGTRKHGKRCYLCLLVVCSACRVKKSLASITANNLLDVRSFSFCTACVQVVTSANAFDIARDEMVRRESTSSNSSQTRADSGRVLWAGSALSPTESDYGGGDRAFSG